MRRALLHRVIAAGVLLAVASPAIVRGQAQDAGSLVHVNGTDLFVRRIGSGEPILVVHGGPVLEHGYLLPHLRPLADSYELIFYDQRLCGRSAGTAPTESIRIATFVEDIEAIRRQLGLGRVHLMAHSWGGLLAMHYALAHPDGLRSLLLLDSMAPSSEQWQREEQVLAGMVSEETRAAMQAIRESDAYARRDPDAIRRMLLASFAPQFADPTRLSALDLYVPDDYPSRSQQFGAMAPDLTDFDLRERLGSIRVPTLVLYGAAEPGAEIGGRAIHDRVAGSSFVLIPDSGHFPFVEQPEAFMAAVRRFLESIARP